jgi:hypothetical protein
MGRAENGDSVTQSDRQTTKPAWLGAHREPCQLTHPLHEDGVLVWFYTRGRDSLRLETRYDNATLEYIGLVTYPDGRIQTKRFSAPDEFRAWAVAMETELATAEWILDGAPYILADGWPKKRPLN